MDLIQIPIEILVMVKLREVSLIKPEDNNTNGTNLKNACMRIIIPYVEQSAKEQFWDSK